MKNKIKIYLLVLLSIFSISQASADEQEDIIDISLSTQEIQMGESVKMQIQIDTQVLKNKEISIDIPGQENFQIFSQSQSTSFQSINGIATSQSIFTLDMRPLDVGDFSLGPVVIHSGTGTIEDDEILNIKVTDILSNIMQKSNTQEDTEQAASGKKQEEKSIKADHSIKKPFLFLFSLLGLFVVVFYFILQLFFKNKQERSVEKIVPEQKEDFFQEMKHYLKRLSEKSQNLSSQEFFQNYNIALRRIFAYQGIDNAHSATLSQLEQNSIFKRHPLADAFRKAYRYEYSEKNVTELTKKKYIDSVLTYIKNTGKTSL